MVETRPAAYIRRTLHLAPFLLAFVHLSAVAQSGQVTFDVREHDFGVIEEGTEAEHTFVFTNTGDAPVQLVQVRPSCGCTTPSWTPDPVAPGETGTVTAVYHSEGRPGPFDKGIAIYTDGEPELLQLRIRGDVAAARMSGLQRGPLVVASESITFPRLRVGPPAVTTLRVQNVTDQALRIDSVRISDARLFTDYNGRTLQSGQSDDITFILDTEHTSSGEAIEMEVTLLTSDASTPEITLPVTGVVE